MPFLRWVGRNLVLFIGLGVVLFCLVQIGLTLRESQNEPVLGKIPHPYVEPIQSLEIIPEACFLGQPFTYRIIADNFSQTADLDVTAEVVTQDNPGSKDVFQGDRDKVISPFQRKIFKMEVPTTKYTNPYDIKVILIPSDGLVVRQTFHCPSTSPSLTPAST
jgi:hypothetical protein